MAVDIDKIADSIRGEIKEHMLEQPYDLKCSECGEGLSVSETEVDGDLDVYIKIDPCAECIKTAVSEAAESSD